MSFFSTKIEVQKTDIILMNKIILHSEPWDVENRLADFDLTRTVCVSIVEAAVMGRNACTDNDPPGASGYESYRWGTRRARELLRGNGWDKEDIGGLACVVNHKRKIRLIVMNADDGTALADRTPQNRCRKGAASERLANANGFLFLPNELPIPATFVTPGDDGYSTWHLCVYAAFDDVRAELSLLSDFENGFFTGAAERIFIVGAGDWPPISPTPKHGNGEDDDQYEVIVTKR